MSLWNQTLNDSFSSSTFIPSTEDLLSIFNKCMNRPNHFAVNLARLLFTKQELRDSNCRGVKQKHPLDEKRLTFIHDSVMKFYQISPHAQVNVWKHCMQGIDTRCRQERRLKHQELHS
ncbi:BEN domain-containing protein [Caerostris darwini]|uniref:BEN domain-containing protein n=1 Tax=Caerostris darwini TaxID=1538125 RepID=A0AAV4PAQ9_9ARAC|nr:BEN domain-containing protein [Caerostris darwini]